MKHAAAILLLILAPAASLAGQAREAGSLNRAHRRGLENSLGSVSLLPSSQRGRAPISVHGSLAQTAARPSQEPNPDPWFGTDKVRHFFTSAAVQGLGYGALRSADLDHPESLLGASALTAILGLGKELHDRRRGYGFSVRDLVWDAAGAAAISALLAKTER